MWRAVLSGLLQWGGNIGETSCFLAFCCYQLKWIFQSEISEVYVPCEVQQSTLKSITTGKRAHYKRGFWAHLILIHLCMRSPRLHEPELFSNRKPRLQTRRKNKQTNTQTTKSMVCKSKDCTCCSTIILNNLHNGMNSILVAALKMIFKMSRNEQMCTRP